MPRHVRQLPAKDVLEVGARLSRGRPRPEAAVPPGDTRRPVQPWQRAADDRLPQAKEAQARAESAPTAEATARAAARAGRQSARCPHQPEAGECALLLPKITELLRARSDLRHTG